jgi:hypothetical protein
LKRVALLLAAVLLLAWCFIPRPVKAEARLAERIASGKAVPSHFYQPVWLWRGLTASLPLSLLLVLAVHLGGRARASEKPTIEKGSAVRLWLVVPLVTLAGLSALRLNHSTWGDEDYTVKTYVREQVTQGKEGALAFSSPTWSEVLWGFKRPNNHVGFTVLARLSHDLLYRSGDKPETPPFSERIVRLPAWVAGVLSVLALFFALRAWGLAGVGGVILLCLWYPLHPWVIRFSSDARGYSLLLLLLPWILVTAKRASETLSWRSWCLLGGLQFYALWTWSSVIYLLLPLNLALPLMLWTLHSEARSAALARWLASGLFTAILSCLVMAPLLPQLRDFMASGAKGLEGGIDLAWLQDAAGYVTAGTGWWPWDRSQPLCVALKDSAWTWVWGAGALSFAGLLLLGAWSLARQSVQRWMLLVYLGGPALMLLHLGLSGLRPYGWYLIIFLPSLLLLAAHGAQRAKRLAMVASLLLPIAAWPQTQVLLQHPTEPCRESVMLARHVMNPHHPDYGKGVITAGFTMFTEAYDPLMVRFENAEELRGLMARARQEQCSLFINFSSRVFCETAFPEIFAILNDPAQFELIGKLPGQAVQCTREVLKAK